MSDIISFNRDPGSKTVVWIKTDVDGNGSTDSANITVTNTAHKPKVEITVKDGTDSKDYKMDTVEYAGSSIIQKAEWNQESGTLTFFFENARQTPQVINLRNRFISTKARD
jgi:hypothetical protein